MKLEDYQVTYISPGILRADRDAFLLLYKEAGEEVSFSGKLDRNPEHSGYLEFPTEAEWPLRVPMWPMEKREIVKARIAFLAKESYELNWLVGWLESNAVAPARAPIEVQTKEERALLEATWQQFDQALKRLPTTALITDSNQSPSLLSEFKRGLRRIFLGRK